LLKNISKDVTYKEIYFLLELFDAIELIKSKPNELFKYIKKYLEKYPYDRQAVFEKKRMLLNSSHKDYVVAFKLDDYYIDEIISTLETLNIDFKVVGGFVEINSFYFNNLANVISSLQSNINCI